MTLKLSFNDWAWFALLLTFGFVLPVHGARAVVPLVGLLGSAFISGSLRQSSAFGYAWFVFELLLCFVVIGYTGGANSRAYYLMLVLVLREATRCPQHFCSGS